MTQVLHEALDGSKVTVTSPDLDLSSDASSVAIYYVDGVAQEFTASYRGFGEAVAVEAGLVFEEEYVFQGGQLRLATGSQAFPTGDADGAVNVVPLHIGTWEGSNYSVHTHVYGGNLDALLYIFDQFLVLESAAGIQLSPKDPKATPLYSDPKIMKDVPEMGLLQVKPLSAETARYLPRWEGTRVVGGELFAEGEGDGTTDGCGKTSFYLIGSTAVSHISPEFDSSQRRVLRHLGALRVGWRRVG